MRTSSAPRVPSCVVLLAGLAAALTGCGGAASPASPTPAPAAAAPAEGPIEACFALAGAKRDKRPDEPEKVGTRHILVKYAGAKSADDSVTRARGAACLRALEARDKARAGASFEDLVKEYSEDPGAASRGGSMGTLTRAEMVPPFADAAFELDVQQLSDVVETEFGFHVILRTE
jgi:peptidyl-prolyl cis-trans isomerase NIMA-interacting 1